MYDLRTHTMSYLDKKYYVLGDSERILIFNMCSFLGLPKGVMYLDGMSDEFADFKIANGQLYLTSFCIASKIDECPELQGVKPIGMSFGLVQYSNLLKRVEFTGNLVFGNSPKNVTQNTTLFRANCLNGDVKGVQDFSEQVQKVRQNIEGLKQQFYQEDAVYSKTSKQKRLLSKKITSIKNDLSEEIYGSDLHNYR